MQKHINTLTELEKIEVVDKRASKKYVPIKSTEFIKSMKSFNFEGAVQYDKKSSGHYFVLSKGDEVSIVVENSFDRSRALRISFRYKDFIFGKVNQKHIGKGAVDLNNISKEIDIWFINAVKTIDSMKTFKLTKDEMKEIAEVAFKERGVKLGSITNIVYKFDNALDFVMYLVRGIKDGEFSRVSRGTDKPLNEVKRDALMLHINYKIWSHLKENFLELYI